MLDNCVEMNEAGDCIECQEFFKVVNGACSLVDPYCEKFATKKGCILCRKGFHLMDNKCFKNDPKCYIYS